MQYTSNAPSHTAPTDFSPFGLRQLTSIGIGILLYSAAIPFTPTTWLLPSLAGAAVLDHFVAGLALLCAVYFQYRLSRVTGPLFVANPFSAVSERYVQNGRIGVRRDPRDGGGEVLFVYRPEDFSAVAGLEVLVLLFAEFAGFEYARRVIVVGVVAALWVVGWGITPKSTKEWAWGHVKVFWFFILFDVLRGVSFGGGSGRPARPGRRY